MTADPPDFPALRAARDAARQRLAAEIIAEIGGDPATTIVHFSGGNGCYCACPEGPCEHEFEGQRDIVDDEGQIIGGESFCRLCGCGAMSHAMRCGP